MSEPRIELDEDTKALLLSEEYVPKEIDLRSRKYYPKSPKGSGFKGVVWAGRDEYDGDVAIKFTVPEDYDNKSYREEATLARKLKSHPRFASFIDAGFITIYSPPEAERRFMCFIEELIPGCTLEEHLQTGQISASFLLNYVKDMCEALNTLKANELQHDDLRPANVMIMPQREGAIDRSRLVVKIVDTGSLKMTSVDQDKERGREKKKDKDDHLWFTHHIVDIWNAVWIRRHLNLMEKRFLQSVIPLINQMLEPDLGVALNDPVKISEQFGDKWTRAQQSPSRKGPEFPDPFDYIAAEHISSDKLLVKLFVESCPWFSEVASPNPLLLTGPRGCGKSMVFRRLSLRALQYKDDECIIQSQIAGFYVSCSADLRNRMSWLTTEAAALRFRREIVHYFNLLLTREVVLTLNLIGQRPDRESLFGFGDVEEYELHEFLMDKLKIPGKEILRLQGVPYMQHALEVTESEMDKCYETMIQGKNLTTSTHSTFIADLTRYLSEHVSYFSEKKIAFLLDDFSIHKLPQPIQSILLPIIWDRQASHIFKLSAEKYGAVVIESMAEPTRELREIDCGRYYLSLQDKTMHNFARELLGIRLALAEYDGTAQQLLGNSVYPEGSLGKALRDRSKTRGRSDNQYYGLETIADSCSGDISCLLEIYRRIFEKGNVKKHSTECVPEYIQHQAIEAVSREMLEVIRHYVPYGSQMYQTAYWFGNLSARILREGYEQKKGDSLVPCQTSRIEVDQPMEAIQDEPTEEQQNLIDELVRRCVFIEMETGRSRHKRTLTLRWQLRKVYCPAFGTALAKNTAVKWGPDDFKWFLIDPERACNDEFEKKWLKTRKSDQQDSLFSKTNDLDDNERR